MKHALSIVCVVLLCGCGSLSKTVLKDATAIQTVEKRIEMVDRKLDTKTQIYVDGALRALKQQAVEHQTKEVKLAQRLLSNAQDVIGVPPHSLRLDVEMLTKDIPDQAELKKLEDLEAAQHKAILERQELERQVADLRDKLADDAIKLAQKHNKSWFETAKDWVWDQIALICIIAVLGFALLNAPRIIGFFTRLIRPI